jgi:hypothetical protein
MGGGPAELWRRLNWWPFCKVQIDDVQDRRPKDGSSVIKFALRAIGSVSMPALRGYLRQTFTF